MWHALQCKLVTSIRHLIFTSNSAFQSMIIWLPWMLALLILWPFFSDGPLHLFKTRYYVTILKLIIPYLRNLHYSNLYVTDSRVKWVERDLNCSLGDYFTNRALHIGRKSTKLSKKDPWQDFCPPNKVHFPVDIYNYCLKLISEPK